MINKFLSLIIQLLNVLFCCPQLKTTTEYLDFEGYKRSYEIFLPENYSGNKEYPLVLILHGGGGTAKNLIGSTMGRFNFLANRDGFIAVYPDGIERSWNDGARNNFGVARKTNINDVGFFKELISVLENKYSIDRRNVFVCGISNGGFMSQRLAFDLSEKIKGIGVVSASVSVVQSKQGYPKNPVPVIFINGTNDPIVPYTGGEIIVFRQERGQVLSVEKSIEIWKNINHCSEKTESYLFPDIDKKDNSTAFKTIWQDPDNTRFKVVAIKIENGGHSWPGAGSNLDERVVGNTNRDFNGCDEIWDFFKSIIEN